MTSGLLLLVTSCRGQLCGDASFFIVGVLRPSESNCNCRIASLRSDPLLAAPKSPLGGVGILRPGGVWILNPCGSLAGMNSFGGKMASSSTESFSKLPAFTGLGIGLGTLKGALSGG